MLPYDVLPALARPLLDRLLAAAARDERIVGVTVGGSAVTGTMDEFSDLDLVLACRDGDFGAVLADVRGLAAAVGPLLAAFSGDHVGEPRLRRCSTWTSKWSRCAISPTASRTRTSSGSARAP